MKTLLSILTLVAIVVLCATGAFVTQSPNTTENLVVLSDADLSQRTGGTDTSALEDAWEGSMASCSVSNCQPVVHFYYPDFYRCEQCTNANDSAYETIGSPKFIKSWCYGYTAHGEPRCNYMSQNSADNVENCDDYIGACGEGWWGEAGS